MKIYTIKYQQVLPISIEQAWEFFSHPKNLEKITPPWLNFKIRSPAPDELPDAMYAGMLVQYHVHPIAGIPVGWTTEITHMQTPHFFVDEQRFGPYKFWHHQHHFKTVAGGVEMTDIIDYALPFGLLGRCLHPWYIKGKLEQIFCFRRQALEQHFGKMVP
jgi:ligand-binding SRPBCC domain-containing protein